MFSKIPPARARSFSTTATAPAQLLDGNGGSIRLSAGTGGIVAASSSNEAAEIATTGATVTMDTSGPIGTGSNPIQFADDANTAQQNVIIDSNPSSVFLDGLGTLTLGNVQGGMANTAINVTAQTQLVTVAGDPFAVSMGGTGELTKTGPGTVTLSGSNAYTGDTTVNSGTLVITDSTALPTSGILTVGDGQSVISMVSSVVVAANTIHLSNLNTPANSGNSIASPLTDSSEPASLEEVAAVAPVVSTPVVAMPSVTSNNTFLAAAVQQSSSTQEPLVLPESSPMTATAETNVLPAPSLPLASSSPVAAFKPSDQEQSAGREPPTAVPATSVLPAPTLPAVSSTFAAALGAVKVPSQGQATLGSQPAVAAVAPNLPLLPTSPKAVQGSVPGMQARAVDAAIMAWISASSSRAMSSLDGIETSLSANPLEWTPSTIAGAVDGIVGPYRR